MRAIFIFFLFLVSLPGSAQSNIRKAKIFTADHRVLEGFLHFSAFEGTPQVFRFSDTENGTPRELGKDNAVRVEVADGTVFETRHVDVVTLASDYSLRERSDYTAAGNLLSADVFVERIVDGKLNLFQFVDRFAYPHFFYAAAGDTALHYLRNQSYATGNLLIRDKAYNNAVYNLAEESGCKEVMRSAEDLDYTLKAMAKAFAQLNRCRGQEVNITAVLERKRDKAAFGLMGGAALNNPGLDHFGSVVLPFAGLYIEAIPGKVYKNYRFNVELLYRQMNATSDSMFFGPPNYGQTKIQSKMLDLSPNVRFYLTKSQRTPFVEAGFQLSYLLDYRIIQEWKEIVFNNQQKRTEESFAGQFMSGFFGGAGYDLQRVSVHLRYYKLGKATLQGSQAIALALKLKLTR